MTFAIYFLLIISIFLEMISNHMEGGIDFSMLEIKKLTKTYPNGHRAVSNLSMTIEQGDIFGFIGKNGAGKTSTLKACLTIHDFDEGEILLNGTSILDDPINCKKKMAFVPDTPLLEVVLCQ